MEISTGWIIFIFIVLVVAWLVDRFLTADKFEKSVMDWRMDASRLSEKITTVEADVREIRGHTAKLDASPQFRGTLGEQVVEHLLDKLPPGSYRKQVSDPKIPGRPDFVVDIPSSELHLVIDAKSVMVTPNTTVHTLVLSTARSITKYIVPGYTFDFVLMWLPEATYYEIEHETYMELFDMNVIPVTTTNLMPVVHMVRTAYKVFYLTEKASEFKEFQENIFAQIVSIRIEYRRAMTQLNNASRNFKSVHELLEKIHGDAMI